MFPGADSGARYCCNEIPAYRQRKYVSDSIEMDLIRDTAGPLGAGPKRQGRSVAKVCLERGPNRRETCCLPVVYSMEESPRRRAEDRFGTTEGSKTMSLARQPTDAEVVEEFNRILDATVAGTEFGCLTDTGIDNETRDILNLLARQPDPKRPVDIQACRIEFARMLDGTHAPEAEERDLAEWAKLLAKRPIQEHEGGTNMGAELVYEIARYGVDTDTEVLIERAQVFSRDGTLWRRVDDGPETPCLGTDVAVVIGADPMVSEVRANEVTRITAKPEALRELPLVLRVPGRGDDLDKSLWSAEMLYEHIDDSMGAERGAYRVLYVNGEPWSLYFTDEGDWLLPEPQGSDFEQQPHLDRIWAKLSFSEQASRMVGFDNTFIGLVTAGAVACVTLSDERDIQLVLELKRRGDDAAVFVEWLLEGWLTNQYRGGCSRIDLLLTQLFVETAVNDRNGESFAGSYLVAGTESSDKGDYLVLDSSEWNLELDLEPAMIDAVLGLLAQRSSQHSDIVTAARDPASPASLARQAALEYWERNHDDSWDLLFENLGGNRTNST